METFYHFIDIIICQRRREASSYQKHAVIQARPTTSPPLLGVTLPRTFSNGSAASPDHCVLSGLVMRKVPKSRLGHMHSLTDHGTSMSNKDQHNRMELEQAGSNGSKGKCLVDPALADPEGQDKDDAKRSGRGKSLEVFCLSRRVVRDGARGDVEAGEAEETAECKAGKEELVEGGADAESEGSSSRRNAKGDLEAHCQQIGRTDRQTDTKRWTVKSSDDIPDRQENRVRLPSETTSSSILRRGHRKSRRRGRGE